MTTAKGNFKFLIQNVIDVIYKEFVVKGQPALQIELAKYDSNLYQCFAADEAGNRCPYNFGNYDLFRKHFNNDKNLCNYVGQRISKLEIFLTKTYEHWKLSMESILLLEKYRVKNHYIIIHYII
jgi:hypothetical protein